MGKEKTNLKNKLGRDDPKGEGVEKQVGVSSGVPSASYCLLTMVPGVSSGVPSASHSYPFLRV